VTAFYERTKQHFLHSRNFEARNQHCLRAAPPSETDMVQNIPILQASIEAQKRHCLPAAQTLM